MYSQTSLKVDRVDLSATLVPSLTTNSNRCVTLYHSEATLTRLYVEELKNTHAYKLMHFSFKTRNDQTKENMSSYLDELL